MSNVASKNKELALRRKLVLLDKDLLVERCIELEFDLEYVEEEIWELENEVRMLEGRVGEFEREKQRLKNRLADDLESLAESIRW